MDNEGDFERQPSREEEVRPESPPVPTKCSICYNEPPVNPIKLACAHIFCYLCIKGVAETTGACALCRATIGPEFNLMEHPIVGRATRVPYSSNRHYWFYEGFRGWWMYDADTNRELEEAFQRGQSRLEKFIAGHTYIIDIDHLTQQREDGEGRSRKICRSTLNLENILGIEGLKGEDIDEIIDMMKSAEAKDMMGTN